MSPRRWRIRVDTGGTFTDCLALPPEGAPRRVKVLSSSALRGSVAAVEAPGALRVEEGWGAPPDGVRGFRFVFLGGRGGGEEARVLSHDPASGRLRLDRAVPAAPGDAFEVRSDEEAPTLAARLATGTPAGAALPPLEMRLATTRGTNALLERCGAPTALFVTEGFADLLRIGDQRRPDLFDLAVRLPEPLHAAVVEVPGRLAADGAELRPLDLAAVREAAKELPARGVRAAAVALMHAWRDPRHEHAVRGLLRELGFEHVSCSADLAPSLRVLPRAQTAVVDAHLAPVIRGYLDRVRGALGGGRLHVATSAGGLVRPEAFRAKDSLLSGPAGGVTGAALAGRRSGFERVIAFDMGGTSTDVARVAGEPEYVWEHEVGGVRVVAPALAIESVAAGGGSVCELGPEGLRVGPRSAGASPGPACYGAGGPLTLTDCNLLLGRLDPERFAIPVDISAAEAAADRLVRAVEERRGERVERDALLAGLLAVADERMADAIRAVSLRRGYDPADHALVAFGGAGGQHACGVAERLGIGAALVPPDAGLLSALGIGHAPLERFAERQLLRPLDEVEGEVDALLAELAEEAVATVAEEGIAPEEVEVRRRIASLRYAGQDASLSVDVEPGADLLDAFARRHAEVFGHRPSGRPVEVEALRVVASSPRPPVEPASPVDGYDPEPHGRRPAWAGGARREVLVFRRDHLRPGARLAGPALVSDRHSTAWLAPGWEAEVDGAGALMMRRVRQYGSTEVREDDVETPTYSRTSYSRTRTPDAVREELFVHRFRALVGEMGEQLRRTALSVNVKERLDFSCALLDPEGRLVVNAPHIPVHLGALGLCVRAVRDALPLGPGDVAVTNHPAFGGSHLPDVTVVTPVHDEGGRLLGWVASRAHHAEIGGARPGSMPPDARTLAEEGVVIPPTHLVRGGEARWEEVRAMLTGGAWPSRAPDDNLADLAAAVAANHRGAGLLRALAAAHGADEVAARMRALGARAAAQVRAALSRLPDGAYEAEQRLDDGAPIRVRVEVRGDRATVDFAGTGPVHPGNLNATPAVVRSAVLYVLRLLVREPLPLNEGLLEAVEVRVPPGMLSPPFPDDPAECPAVVGGNVEVSQRLVDALLRALGLAAGSQGTMNNTLWGDDRFGYYETVCGGCGAGPEWDGASAVHSHMTNTAITDPEVVEHRHPVRVERFAVRRGSGGAGRRRGGDGVVRETVFLAPLRLSVLTQHRAEGPYGMEGGHDGAPGRQRVVRASGETVELGSVDGCEVGPGDRLVMETPGGGGWGAPEGEA